MVLLQTVMRLNNRALTAIICIHFNFKINSKIFTGSWNWSTVSNIQYG